MKIDDTEQSPPDDPTPEQASRDLAQTASRPSSARRPALVLLPVAVIVAVLAGVTVALLSGSTKPRLPGNANAAHSAQFAGGTLTPVRAAPPIALRNYLGRPVTLSQYRGRVVLVTFLYTHCPDVCPLITEKLKATLGVLGARARDVQIIAVSVDPNGDTRSAVADFLRHHGMTGRMQYLIGNGRELGRAWSAWYVGSERDASSPDRVAHSALVYGITVSGRLLTIYPANFRPADLAHDVQLLAGR